VIDRVINQDVFTVLDHLPEQFADLVFADPPYNLTKSFNGRTFSAVSLGDYEAWLKLWIPKLAHLAKPTASIYICSDWRSSAAVHRIIQQHFVVRNRITWEREKGRGAITNWKNCAEDIWFCTVSDDYTFNVDAVKLKRKVLAPYTADGGAPKDWEHTDDGRFRLTHPSNVWTDLTVPFWSMSENTDHPTQKPEKLLAKIILASSNEGDMVFDPFLESGTTATVAKKLCRHHLGVEIDETYCCLAEKRIEMAENDHSIQGYSDGYFWERNTLAEQKPDKQNHPLEKVIQHKLF
jgi:site-specific DNA-methyltransferase (adenine-specific)